MAAPRPEKREGVGAADDTAPPRPANRPIPDEVVVVDGPAGAVVDAPKPENRLGPPVLDAVGRLPNRGFGALEAGWLPPRLPKRLMAVVAAEVEVEVEERCVGARGGAAC